MFRANLNIKGLIMHLQNRNRTLKTDMCLVFYCRLCFLLFLLVATFLIINFSILCFLCIAIYEPHMFCQTFLPVGV